MSLGDGLPVGDDAAAQHRPLPANSKTAASLAAIGIALGAGALLAAIVALAFVAGIFFERQQTATAHRGLALPSPGATTSWTLVPASPGSTPSTSSSPSPSAESISIGTIHVMDIDPKSDRTFHQQLADEYRRAADAHQTVVVMTTAKRCDVCREIEASLPDPRMQVALTHVDLVRVDVEDFDAELGAAGMEEDTLPWFYKLDARLRPLDAINAGEWDDNVPENMAPVLGAFLGGTLRARRDSSAMGTSL